MKGSPPGCPFFLPSVTQQILPLPSIWFCDATSCQTGRDGRYSPCHSPAPSQGSSNGRLGFKAPAGNVLCGGTMIRPERLTIKAQEVLRDALDLAKQRGNPVVNDAHLFAALLEQDEGIVQPL